MHCTDLCSFINLSLLSYLPSFDGYDGLVAVALCGIDDGLTSNKSVKNTPLSLRRGGGGGREGFIILSSSIIV